MFKICIKKFDAEKIFFDKLTGFLTSTTAPRKLWFDTAQFLKSTAPRASIGFFNNLQIFISVNLFVFQIAGVIK